MKLSITSVESNAVFDLIAFNDSIIGTELTQQSLVLPQTRDYRVIVGGTRSNASYDLAIAIEQKNLCSIYFISDRLKYRQLFIYDCRYLFFDSATINQKPSRFKLCKLKS